MGEREYSLVPPSPPQAPKLPLGPDEISSPSTTLPEPPDIGQSSKGSEVKAQPHAVDYFNVQMWIEIASLNPSLDAYGMRDKVYFIEDYVARQIKAMGIADEKKSYHFVLSEIEKRLGLDSKMERRERIERLWQFLKTSEKMQKQAEKKRQTISALNNQFAGRRNE